MLSFNLIQYFVSILTGCLPSLKTLQITHNKLTMVSDVGHLKKCLSLSVVDLSHNQIEDPAVLDVFAAMPSLVKSFLLRWMGILFWSNLLYWFIPNYTRCNKKLCTNKLYVLVLEQKKKLSPPANSVVNNWVKNM